MTGSTPVVSIVIEEPAPLVAVRTASENPAGHFSLLIRTVAPNSFASRSFSSTRSIAMICLQPIILAALTAHETVSGNVEKPTMHGLP
jgi:hypothetical protein